jgi:superfamily II DNA or RNA helicase
MDRVLLVGDVVDNWLRIAPDRKTVGFATSVRHSIAMAEAFNEAGVRAAHIDGTTPKDERDAVLQDATIRVLWNCDVLTEGWDQPEVSCCVLAKPTKSFTRYMQMVGRVLRPFPGKPDAIVIDHAGAVHEHGFVEEPVEWGLRVDEPAAKRPVQRRREEADAEPLVCGECLATYVGRGDCPECGWRPEIAGRDVQHIDADLGLVKRPHRHSRKQNREYTREQMRSWWHGLLGFAAERGYKRGWAFHKYREKFGSSPPKAWGSEPAEPEPVVRNWCRSRIIAFAKSKDAGGAT